MPGTALLDQATRSSAGPSARAGRPIPAVLFLLVWGTLSSFVVAILMSGHWIALPTPSPADPGLGAVLGPTPGGAARSWTLAHVLYADCRCSQRIFDYLLERSTPPGVRERVLLVGHDESWTERARRRGVEVVPTTADELSQRYQIESAPLLLVGDTTGTVRYVGGHSSRKQGPRYEDLAILEELRAGRAARGLPVFGCGITADLRKALDPLGLR